jgi:hypothetical protein
VLIGEDVGGVPSFLGRLDDDGLEVVQHLLYVLHVVELVEGVPGLLRVHLVLDEIFARIGYEYQQRAHAYKHLARTLGLRYCAQACSRAQE